MKVKKTAFGNFNEAFIEHNYSDKLNVIYSNDNNKGKTLVIQGLLYALGNTPIFPSGFNYKDYYFYTMIELNGNIYEFLRKKATTIILDSSGMHQFDSLSELKYFMKKNLFDLPIIEKGGEDKVVDLSLFYQLFYIGQDKRNTSNIQNSGHYNKKDFLSMLNSLNGYKQSTTEGAELESIKKDIGDKKAEIQVNRKKMKIAKEQPELASQAISSVDLAKYEEQSKRLEEISSRITNHKKQRTRETNRKVKLKDLLIELKSINRKIEIGKVVCAECGSERVMYTNGDMSFDVSNVTVRNNIINSIEEQISIKAELIDELTSYITDEQEALHLLLEETPSNFKNILLFREEILSDREHSTIIIKLKAEISSLEEQLESAKNQEEEGKEQNKLMIKAIINKMNDYYREIDPDGNLVFDKLFTKNEENYSGSEEQEFYFSKLLAINDYFKHSFPIIIDSFRSGELSTSKEVEMLKYYKNLNKQVILTSTLKKEEYERLKYDEDTKINALDYSFHENSKVLNESHAGEFRELLDKFSIIE